MTQLVTLRKMSANRWRTRLQPAMMMCTLWPMGQLRRAKARALAAMGRQERYDVSATVPADLSEFSYKLPHELSKEQSKPPGHSEV